MKTKYVIALGALFLSTGSVLNAQTTIYDANRLMGTDLNGTARYVGMGGAMGALGGDISTMSTNPAGIGVFRSNDAMISFGFTNMGAKDIGGSKVDKFHGSFDNAGFVFSTKIGNSTPLRYLNFGFNYRRTKSFNKNIMTGGVFGQSQTSFMADILNYDAKGNFKPWEPSTLDQKGAYENPDLPWIGLLAFDSRLVEPVYVKKKDQNGVEKDVFDHYNHYFKAGDKVAQAYSAKERGGLHSYDFNIALNLYDRFYLGATIGAYSVDYRRTSLYKEDFTASDGSKHGGYDLRNEYWVDGSGVDFKLGVIWRPIETSSFRIGGAIHTPTFFSLTENNRASINYKLDNASGTKYPVNNQGNPMDGEFKYTLVTPWKYNINMGYTIGSIAALGLEYEYSDYSSAKLKDPDGRKLQQTDDIRSMLKGVHTLRTGVEFKVAPQFSFRLGYNHVTASMKKSNAFKNFQDNSVRTDTEYSNPGAINNYTLGCGYRGETFYVDMAYQFNTYKEQFYAFDNKNLPETEITNSNHKVLFTLGMRF